ncbi:SO_0444 family Cu/Zn efflux transporter [Magnetospira sp. QH-2]|uniref:SO_0444 family Cu/Zn efflux transporter n=1 Tax=Magnetospira sp. (strain QH-2) TaxID=1288970 RepID=UPI0003E80EC4|nr:SO_0444 family Cu/Zn efflux transporter [Magnetospira sp. QH-2]CCQ74901.1 putative permease [Magnetospira sp. QH-2]
MASLFLDQLMHLYLEAAPWLLFGLVIAGAIKAWFPEDGIKRWLGGRGLKPTVTAAVIGAPLPLCSCGVLPAAIGLRRAGASREATTSFLVSTPETGADSIAISYVLLGPFMTVARPVGALFSAIVTGLMMMILPREPEKTATPLPLAGQPTEASCSTGCCGSDAAPAAEKNSVVARTVAGVRYALTDILQDITPWLVFGFLAAAAVAAFVPPQALTQWGTGLMGMTIMVIISIPMYVCATAATPIAAGLLMAGVSPGATLVFLLAGPATNMATIGVVRKEMGNQALMVYLGGIIATAIVAGFAVDLIANRMGIDIVADIQAATEIVPLWIAWASGVLLMIAVAWPKLTAMVPSKQKTAAAE